MTKTKHTLKDLLSKKKWYYKNSEITEENFPTPEKIQTENWKVIKMNKSFSSQEALERIKKEGCRPANIYELALFANEHAEQFPDGQWTGMLAFGTDYIDSDGIHRVPCVRCHSDGDWGFGLGRFGLDWHDGYCLLCFCDQTLDTQTLEKDSSGSLTLDRYTDMLEWLYLNTGNQLTNEMKQKLLAKLKEIMK